MPETFVNPRVAAKRKKREENKRKAIEKREREKVNKALRKALGNPQKLFDDLQEANNVIKRLTDSVNEEAESKEVLAVKAAGLEERLQLILADKLALKAENKQLTAERNAAKECLDWKEKRDILVPLAQSKLLCEKLVASNKELEGQIHELRSHNTQLENSSKALSEKLRGLEIERDALKMELADALGKPPLAAVKQLPRGESVANLDRSNASIDLGLGTAGPKLDEDAARSAGPAEPKPFPMPGVPAGFEPGKQPDASVEG